MSLKKHVELSLTARIECYLCDEVYDWSEEFGETWTRRSAKDIISRQAEECGWRVVSLGSDGKVPVCRDCRMPLGRLDRAMQAIAKAEGGAT